MPERQPPFTDTPLRLPGQSLSEEMEKVYDNQVNIFAFTASIMIAFILYLWFAYLVPTHQNPILVTIIGGFVLIYCLWRINKAKKYIKNLSLGREGELIVAEQLEELRQEGSVVFHDIVGKAFNIDHVVLSKHGIFLIETKTYSKYPNSRVKYDGKTLLVDGMKPDRDALVQATAGANWLRNELQKSTGKLFYIRPVVVFPGWFVETSANPKTTDVWVYNPKMLPGFMRGEGIKLKDDDLHLAAYHLSRMNRNK